MDNARMHEEVKAVKELGEKIGYGHMMGIASALWRASLEEMGCPTDGAFVAALLCDVKMEDQEDHINFITDLVNYDKIIKL